MTGKGVMNKLSISVYNKLISQKATSREIDFVLYLARYQNAWGEVEGVYHKDVEAELGISGQTFYDLKRSLTDKGIISCTKRNYVDWDITLLDNEFLDKDAYKKGYFQLHLGMFASEQFRKMKAGSKLLAMQFLRMNMINQSAFKKKVVDFFADYGKALGVKMEALRVYLTEIKAFFYINIANKVYYFKVKKVATEVPNDNKTENANYNQQIYNAALRRSKIKKTYMQQETDILKYLNAHHNELVRMKAGSGFLAAVKQSINIINQDKPVTKKPKRVLRPSLIKQILSPLLREPASCMGAEEDWFSPIETL